MPSWRTIALFGLTALAGLAFVVYLSSGGVQDPLPHRVGAIGRPRVPRLQWQSTRDFLPTLFANSTPVVLFGTPADIWPALNLWTPQHLSREPTGATILDVFVSSAADTSSDGAAPGRSRAFYSTYDNFELARVAGVASWRQTTRLQRMSLQHFWNRGSAPRFLKGALSNFPEDHWQHVRPRELQATAALRDADDGSGKFVEYGSAGSGPSAEANLDARAAAELSLFDVWMGSPGAVSAAHYDLQNNLYVQLNGTKQFTLAPPASFRECGVFPALHPRHRQARRHVSPLDATGECLPQGAVVATLSPGDVLFIPPLWLHTAQALTDAVSVSCCSGSAADLVAVALEAAPIPFESAWSTDLCAIALVVYVNSLAAAVLPEELSATLGERLWRDRYAGLVDLDTLEAEAVSAAPAEFHSVRAACSAPDGQFAASIGLRTAVQRGVDTVAAPLLQAIQSDDARDIVLQNMAEIWAGFFFLEHGAVYWLRYCLREAHAAGSHAALTVEELR